MEFSVRLVTLQDEAFLWEMLYQAAHMEETGENFSQAKTNPALSCYVDNWGRKGDIGCIVQTAQQQPVCAAWVRIFDEQNRGYGYVREGVPELAMGTVKQYRRMGAGTMALNDLIEKLRPQYSAVSLSVRDSNSEATTLYKKLGFQRIPDSEVTNRAGGTSFVMMLQL